MRKKHKPFCLKDSFKHFILLFILSSIAACSSGSSGGDNNGNGNTDISPPDTSISTSPDSPTNATSASFTFSSTEARATFECSINNGAFATCTSPENNTNLTEGDNTFSVRATDSSGNTDTTPAVFNWVIDTTAPDISVPADIMINATGANGILATDAAIQIFINGATATDNVDENISANISNDAPETFPIGTTTVTFSVTDAAGNTASNTASIDVLPVGSDITPPDTSVSSNHSNPTNTTSASFIFDSTEAGSTFKCSINNEAFAPCTSPKIYTNLAEGNNTFSVRATDGSANTDPTPASIAWVIDTTPPDVSVPADILVEATDANGILASEAVIQTFLNSATATDNVDGNISANISNDTPTTFSIGTTTVTFSVTDSAGNTGSNTATVEVVDSMAPDTASIIINNNAEIAIVANALNARLLASDNVGITDYLITEHNSTDPMNVDPPYLGPLSSDNNWVAISATTSLDITIPFSLTQSYNVGDTVALCVWFMDAAGNVSNRVCDTIVYGEGWETGIGNWYVDNGVWQVGTPTAGPSSCFSGTQCAATVLDGNYPAYTDSRLISPAIQLTSITDNEEIHLRFQHWFSYAANDSGQVQISVWDTTTSTWGNWTSEGIADTNTSGGWTQKDVLLTLYAGKTVRIGFYHTAARQFASIASESTGWYIDDIIITVF